MAWSYIMDMQIPKNYWYWAICQAVQAMNYIPCNVEGISTTPDELTYGVKPDLHTLFHLFSVGFFRHGKDGSHHRSGISNSRSMQGIALGRCRKSDGMIFYSPHTKEIYTSSDYKLDEGHNMPNTFSLTYYGGIFVGLYNSTTPTKICKPFPEGILVAFPIQSRTTNDIVRTRGIVISVPLPRTTSQLSVSNKYASPYTICLVDGTTHRVSPDFLDSIVMHQESDTHLPQFPCWLGQFMYLHNDEYLKGHMAWDADNSQWCFTQCKKNGIELFGVKLPNFHLDFQHFIDDGTLVPGWHSSKKFLCYVTARHILASLLTSMLPPGSITKSLHLTNPDHDVWLQSHQEEYDGHVSNNTFQIIYEEEYHALKRQ
jgi:hypothetical protein